MRNSVSSSNTSAQCSAVISPRLWPMAASAVDAKFVQHFQPGQRGGDDGGLHHARRNAVTLGRQLGARIKFAHGLETPPPDAAVQMRRRTLAGKQKSNSRRAPARTRERRLRKNPVRDGTPLCNHDLSVCSRSASSAGLEATTAARTGPRPRCAFQLGRQVGQFRPRKPRGEGQKFFHLRRKLLRRCPPRAETVRRPGSNATANVRGS